MTEYLEKIKNKVQEAREEIVRSYEDLVDNLIVPQLAKHKDCNSVITAQSEILMFTNNEYFNVKEFLDWLKIQGFLVTVEAGGKDYSIVIQVP